MHIYIQYTSNGTIIDCRCWSHYVWPHKNADLALFEMFLSTSTVATYTFDPNTSLISYYIHVHVYM